eukprot:Opistho-1_new@104258
MGNRAANQTCRRARASTSTLSISPRAMRTRMYASCEKAPTRDNSPTTMHARCNVSSDSSTAPPKRESRNSVTVVWTVTDTSDATAPSPATSAGTRRVRKSIPSESDDVMAHSNKNSEGRSPRSLIHAIHCRSAARAPSPRGGGTPELSPTAASFAGRGKAASASARGRSCCGSQKRGSDDLPCANDDDRVGVGDDERATIDKHMARPSSAASSHAAERGLSNSHAWRTSPLAAACITGDAAVSGQSAATAFTSARSTSIDPCTTALAPRCPSSSVLSAAAARRKRCADAAETAAFACVLERASSSANPSAALLITARRRGPSAVRNVSHIHASADSHCSVPS